MQQNLHELLNKCGYICDESFALKVKLAINTKPSKGAFLFGPPGSGKSFLPEALAKSLKLEHGHYIFKQCMPNTREEDLLMSVFPDDTKKSGINVIDGVMVQACRASLNKLTILTLDEWDKTRPSADSFLLDFLQTGRINHKGVEIQANLENLIVFLTMNDERMISEPLLRRLPKIDFQFLESSLVREALMRTHNRQDLIDLSIEIYQGCLIAKLNKPATIQELRQFMDAVVLAGKKADFDQLIYQFITKTPENHNKLKQVETLDKVKLYKEIKPKKNEKLSDEAWGKGYVKEIKDKQNIKFPRLFITEYEEPIVEFNNEINPEKTGGIVEYNNATYNKLVKLFSKEPNNDAAHLGFEGGMNFKINNGMFEITENINIVNFKKIELLWGISGEIVFEAPNATAEDIKNLQSRGLEIRKYGKVEGVIGEYRNILIVWTETKPTRVFVDLEDKQSFLHLFGVGNSSNNNGNLWLSNFKPIKENEFIDKNDTNKTDYGLMFLKHSQDIDFSLWDNDEPSTESYASENDDEYDNHFSVNDKFHDITDLF